MTPYTFECPVTGHQIDEMHPFGEAPRERPCLFAGHDHDMKRVFGNVCMKFTYGKERFHGATINEQLEAQHKQWNDEGRKVEFVGSRWV